MGNSLRTEAEILEEKLRYLRMSKEEKRSGYHDGHVTIDDVCNWQEYSATTTLPKAGSAKYSANSNINGKVSLWQGDMTRLEIDGIVNSAATLVRGEVNSLIIKKAGPFYKEEVLLYGVQPRGEVLVTGGYRLPAKYVVSTLSPRFADANILQGCYKNSLNAAKERGIRTIAFPCIATNKVGGFKKQPAALIALETVRKWIETNHRHIDRVIFCVFKPEDLRIYRIHMQEYFPKAEAAGPSGNGAQAHANTSTSCRAETQIKKKKNKRGPERSNSTAPHSRPLPAPPRLSQSLPRPRGEEPHRSQRDEEEPDGLSISDRSTLNEWRRENEGPTHYNLTLRRSDKDVFLKQILKFYLQPDANLTDTPYVTYNGEEGIDLGAMSREFFSEALDCLKNAHLQGSVAYQGSQDHQLPCASKVLLKRGLYYVTGKALAHSVLHGGIGLSGMSRALAYVLFHHIGQADIAESEIPISVDDVADYDLQGLLKVESIRQLTRANRDALRGHIERFEEAVNIKDDADFEYIKQELILNEVIEKRWLQIEELRRGMDELGLYSFLCKYPTAANIREVFPTSEEFVLDPAMIKEKIKYDKDGSQQHYEFFDKLLGDIHNGKLEGITLNTVLQFWTASPLLPNEHLCLTVDSVSTYPTASTCLQKLALPGALKKYTRFKLAFSTALNLGAFGFGQD